MAKQEYINYSYVPPYCDGLPLTRIQSINITADYGTEDMYQMGDTGIVQTIPQNPSFSVTIEENFIGSVDNMALLMDKVIPYQLNTYGVEDSRTGVFMDSFTTANSIYRPLNHLDILNAYADLLVPVADSQDNSILRTILLHRLAMTGFSGSFDVNGSAKLSYTLSGSQKYYFMNEYDSIKAYVLRNNEISTFSPNGVEGTAQAFTVNTAGFPNGCTVIGIFIDRHTAFINNVDDWDIVTHNANDDHHGFQLSRQNSLSWKSTPWGDTSDASNSEKVTILYKHNGYSASGPVTDGSGEEDYTDIGHSHDSNSLGGLARQYFKFFLWNSAYASKSNVEAAGTFERVQSITFNVAPETEDKFQLGDKYAFATERKTPVEVTGTISLLASDLEVLTVICGTANTSLDIVHDGMYQESVNLQIEAYKTETKADGDKTATIKLSNCTITGDAESFATGSDSTIEINFKTDNIYITPTGVDPNS